MYLFSGKTMYNKMFVRISTSKSIMIHMNTCNLFQATNILSCYLFTMYILALYLHIYNKIAITALITTHPKMAVVGQNM